MNPPASSRDRDVRASLDALRCMVQALRLASGQVERALSISMAQLFVLEQLAAKTLTDPSSVSVVVQRLVARRLGSRRPDPADARRAQLRLTRSGRALHDRAPEPLQGRLVAALFALNDQGVSESVLTPNSRRHRDGARRSRGEPALREGDG
ncbi:MAG: MarR family transcriptional regulator [Polyangiales bacterium]